MKTKTLLASIAVSSLVLAQPAAAATRSYESLPANGVQVTTSAERVGSLTAEDEELRGRRAIWALILLLGLTAALIILLTGSKSTG